MEKELRELGLTENESLIYLHLLKKGETTTGSIIKETQIANSRVYESLNTLVGKGLVSYNVQKDGKHFQAESPNKFIELEEQRKKKISELVPQLNNLKNTKEKETLTAVYEGYEGFKTAFRKIVYDCPVNGVIDVFGFSQPQYKSENLSLFLNNLNLKSIKKRQKLRLITDISSRGFQEDIAKAKNTEVKYMPSGYLSPAAMDIFEDYVYIFLWEEKPFVFMIKNKLIAESFKQYFNVLWTIAK
ncbi:HTH-type sugar sensing transcriptional regulator TrmBL1 [uncultured archaeon]|nr:HTH-type sugar sensing transcriptional regulator TrmBL1 [uncultured archaeon]